METRMDKQIQEKLSQLALTSKTNQATNYQIAQFKFLQFIQIFKSLMVLKLLAL